MIQARNVDPVVLHLFLCSCFHSTQLNLWMDYLPITIDSRRALSLQKEKVVRLSFLYGDLFFVCLFVCRDSLFDVDFVLLFDHAAHNDIAFMEAKSTYIYIYCTYIWSNGYLWQLHCGKPSNVNTCQFYIRMNTNCRGYTRVPTGEQKVDTKYELLEWPIYHFEVNETFEWASWVFIYYSAVVQLWGFSW